MVSLLYCKKSPKNDPGEHAEKKHNDISAPPPTTPTISSGTQLYDQLSHLAVNLAGIAENNALNNISSAAFMNIITQLIPSGEEEVSILTIDNAMVTSPPTAPKFTLGSTTSSDLYQAVLYSSNSYTVTPPITNPRLPDFYSGFNRNGKSYYTLLRIPEFATQQSYNPAVHGPIIFIPRDVLGQTTYFGYSWDASTSSIDAISLDDNAVEDHIDNSTAYIVVVDFDEVSTSVSGSRNASDCEGGWSCTDGYCDSICGENQSCYDCNAQFNKRLVLTDILIKDDERYRTPSGNGDVKHKHFVSALGGRYKVGLNAVVLHANGKWEAINGKRIKQTWSKREVKRVVYSSGKIRSRGAPTWQEVELKDEPGPVLLSNHFNMDQAKIYINLYEIDVPFGAKHDYFAPSYNGVGINNSQFWQSSWMPSLTGLAKGSYSENPANNPLTFQLSDAAPEIPPSRWKDPSGALKDTIWVEGTNVRFILRVYNK